MKCAAESEPGPGPGAAALAERVQALQAFYRRVQVERMQGVALLNPALAVQALGFAWRAGANGAQAVAEGVLITPWFMSLLRLPAQVQGHQGRVGLKQLHDFGNESFEFIGAHDPLLGFHEACALFSPMGDFSGQPQAVDTAMAVLDALRTAPLPATATAVADTVRMPARRAFFAARRATPELTRA